MRLFLDEIYDRRLKVLSYINNSKEPKSVKEIAEATNLAKRTVSMFIRQFEQELDVSEKVFKIHYVNQTINSVSINNLDLNSIGSNYLLNSTIYKIIKHIFLFDKLDVAKFCEAEFISAATFSRHRKKLREILLRCGLDLSRENSFIGDEFRIRNFFFLFFFNASNTWEFDKQEYMETYTYFSKNLSGWEQLDSIKQLKIILLVYISLIRSKHKNYAENQTLIELSKKRATHQTFTLLFNYFSATKNKTTEQVWGETSATAFYIYKDDILSEPIEIESYEEYFSMYYFPFIDFSKEVTNQIINTFFAESDNKELYLNVRKEIDRFYLVRNISFIDYRIFYYVYDEEQFYYADTLETEMKEKLLSICQQLGVSEQYDFQKYETQEVLLDYLYLIVYTLQIRFNSVEYIPVQIFIQNTKLFITDILIQKVSLFFGDRVRFVETLSPSVDLIITDIKVIDEKNQVEQVYVSTFSDLSDMSYLFEQIQKKLLEKYSQRKMYLQNDK
ncbi:hypothetical protein A5821_002037 [Enterococcus sp. 7F3_DIV0205]|uniref:Mga helix-turn-helix domain-containing protein n=1 Tax=Candidatus Enterococcus palustris TaxID=1834189 RepID=A0AAQ3Y7V4_9ENTE|nr:helix-turn-helix domain-containing protein [Enterococcus sp. 7F3_DIV0205]OTN82476.1 hypothetical protein A5821_002387 [Enterococcus sp. 7F3_DIV0205]